MPRSCSICTHPQRDAIDAALVAAQPNRRIAAECGVNEASVRRHAAAHLPRSLIKAAAVDEAVRVDDLLGLAQRLQREFPNSGFVDDALLQLAEVARKQGNLNRAIGVFSRLVSMQTSQLRGEAQFGIAECYREMADDTEGPRATQLYDRAFQEYKKVFDQFPDSGRVGESVAQMANYYYRQKDYSRAVDTFETVLSNHPDAKFLDVILFNYGRCLYRMDRKADARRRFDQLIADYPESTLASDAKKISEALATAGG